MSQSLLLPLPLRIPYTQMHQFKSKIRPRGEVAPSLVSTTKITLCVISAFWEWKNEKGCRCHTTIRQIKPTSILLVLYEHTVRWRGICSVDVCVVAAVVVIQHHVTVQKCTLKPGFHSNAIACVACVAKTKTARNASACVGKQPIEGLSLRTR